MTKSELTKSEQRIYIIKETASKFEEINKSVKDSLAAIKKYIDVIGEPDTLINKELYKDADIIIDAINNFIKNIDGSIKMLDKGADNE